ncbi:Oxysterol-binding protein-domain-containing protein [Gongronella butleri]|nr:Oxysterol-binding protein-domain-containing protein [Gongronella butleri]
MEVLQVQPRDTYLHYVYVPTKNTSIQWSFTTKRNNIQFGVYKRHGQEPLPSSSEVYFRSHAVRQASLPAGELLARGASESGMASSAVSTHSGLSVTNSSSSRPRAKSMASVKLREQGFSEIIPIQHTNSSQTKIEGSLVVPEPGNYVLVFDNTFSRNTPKLLTLSVTLSEGEPAAAAAVMGSGHGGAADLTGWLLKKRRKKMQGWAKRWFSLSPSGVLSYSTSPQGVPRGMIQIRISSISTQPKTKAIHIDSGTMIYHLKALSQEDHETWTKHLKKHRASGLETEVESFQEWRMKRQSRHVSAVARDKARIDITRGLQGSATLKEKLEALQQWIQQQKQKEGDTAALGELDAIHDDLELAIETQDQQWHVIQETVLPLSNTGSSSALASPIRATTPTMPFKPDVAADQAQAQAQAQVQAQITAQEAEYAGSLFSRDSVASDEFYDANDVDLSDHEEPVHVVDDAGETTEEDDEYDEAEPEPEEEEAPSPVQAAAPKDWTNQAECPLRRQRLPCVASSDVGSALSVFRKNVGKDLSTIAMPVSMNEPINMLQKACEELEYSELLDKAATLDDPLERLVYVTVFAISSYASSQYRTGRKPFNPMMTETYENIRPDKGFRFVAEKVCHNPLTIAAHAESKNYKYWQCTKIKSKFWGKSMEFMTEGVFHVTLEGRDDHFTYAKPSSWMRNMIAGEKYLEHAGEMKVVNQSTGEYAIVQFKEGTGGGLFGAPTNRNDIVATVYSKNGKKVKRIVGKWSDKLTEEIGMDKRRLAVLWTANSPGIDDYTNYYGFTRFCMELNEITSLEKGKLPITDTRFRPDQRLYEEGRVDEADAEKQRIEQKQRERRKQFEIQGVQWTPRWFTLQDDPYNEPSFVSPDNTVPKSWVFNQEYWTARETGQWPKDLFELW